MTQPRVLATWLEVRCCCQPTKLLGYLPVDSERLALAERFLGGRLRFQVAPAMVHWQVSAFTTPATTYTPVPARYVELEVRGFADQVDVDDDGVVHWNERQALSSEDTPIEQLRLIQGFVESPQSAARVSPRRAEPMPRLPPASQ